MHTFNIEYYTYVFFFQLNLDGKSSYFNYLRKLKGGGRKTISGQECAGSKINKV